MSDSRAARFIGRPATLTPWLCISRARAETYHSCPPKTYWWPGARSTSVPSKFHSCGLTEWGSSEPPAFRSMPDRSMCSSIHSLWMMHRAALQSRDDFGDEQRPVAQQVRLYAAVPVAVHKRPQTSTLRPSIQHASNSRGYLSGDEIRSQRVGAPVWCIPALVYTSVIIVGVAHHQSINVVGSSITENPPQQADHRNTCRCEAKINFFFSFSSYSYIAISL